MPLFYFHLRTPTGLDRDDTGLEFAGIEEAYLEACRSVPEMSSDLVRKAANPIRYGFEITDVSGRLLMEVPFAEVLDRGRTPAAPSGATRFRKARAEMERTVRLISSIDEERAALQVTLTETKRLLALARRSGQAWLWRAADQA